MSHHHGNSSASDHRWHTTNEDSSHGTNSSTDSTGNHQGGGGGHFISQLLLESSQQQRQALIIISAFGIAASIIVIWTILNDAYSVKSGQIYSRAQKSTSFLRILHPTEVFPFIIATVAILQGVIFIAVEAGALNEYYATGCGLTAQLIWPTTWIVTLTIMIFSLETTFRSLCRKRFRARGKWTTPSCLAVLMILLLGLWLVAFLMPAEDTCPGSLIWWTVDYAKIAVVMDSGMILTHFITGTLLVVQLMRTIHMERDERIAATKIIYSVGINIAILALALPFWSTMFTSSVPLMDLDFNTENNTPARIAEIAITLSGILHAILHIVMRANSERLAIRARQTPWAKKRGIRLFGPNDLNHGSFISTPLIAQPESSEYDFVRSEKGSVGSESMALSPVPRARLPSTSELQTQYATRDLAALRNMPPLPLADPQTVARRGRSQSQSRYSIFPTKGSDKRPALLSWGTDRTGASDEVTLPAPLFSRRVRQASVQTSATVEIGLRLSNAFNGMGFRMGSRAESGAYAYSPQSSSVPILFAPDMANHDSERGEARPEEEDLSPGADRRAALVQSPSAIIDSQPARPPTPTTGERLNNSFNIRAKPREIYIRRPSLSRTISSTPSNLVGLAYAPTTPTPTSASALSSAAAPALSAARAERKRQVMKSLPPVPRTDDGAQAATPASSRVPSGLKVGLAIGGTPRTVEMVALSPDSVFKSPLHGAPVGGTEWPLPPPAEEGKGRYD